MKDVQATGEAFILLKFWGMFALIDPDGFAFPMRIWFRNQPTKINADS